MESEQIWRKVLVRAVAAAPNDQQRQLIESFFIKVDLLISDHQVVFYFVDRTAYLEFKPFSAQLVNDLKVVLNKKRLSPSFIVAENEVKDRMEKRKARILAVQNKEQNKQSVVLAQAPEHVEEDLPLFAAISDQDLFNAELAHNGQGAPLVYSSLLVDELDNLPSLFDDAEYDDNLTESLIAPQESLLGAIENNFAQDSANLSLATADEQVTPTLTSESAQLQLAESTATPVTEQNIASDPSGAYLAELPLTQVPSGSTTSVATQEALAQPTYALDNQQSPSYGQEQQVQPSVQESSQPLVQPSVQEITPPLTQPSVQESTQPLIQPSVQERSQTLIQPSVQESTQPLIQPSVQESTQPLIQPSVQESSQPLIQPSVQESTQPLIQPSTQESLVHSHSQPQAHALDTTVATTNVAAAKPSTQLNAAEQLLSLLKEQGLLVADQATLTEDKVQSISALLQSVTTATQSLAPETQTVATPLQPSVEQATPASQANHVAPQSVYPEQAQPQLMEASQASHQTFAQATSLDPYQAQHGNQTASYEQHSVPSGADLYASQSVLQLDPTYASSHAYPPEQDGVAQPIQSAHPQTLQANQVSQSSHTVPSVQSQPLQVGQDGLSNQAVYGGTAQAIGTQPHQGVQVQSLQGSQAQAVQGMQSQPLQGGQTGLSSQAVPSVQSQPLQVGQDGLSNQAVYGGTAQAIGTLPHQGVQVQSLQGTQAQAVQGVQSQPLQGGQTGLSGQAVPSVQSQPLQGGQDGLSNQAVYGGTAQAIGTQPHQGMQVPSLQGSQAQAVQGVQSQPLQGNQTVLSGQPVPSVQSLPLQGGQDELSNQAPQGVQAQGVLAQTVQSNQATLQGIHANQSALTQAAMASYNQLPQQGLNLAPNQALQLDNSHAQGNLLSQAATGQAMPSVAQSAISVEQSMPTVGQGNPNLQGPAQFAQRLSPFLGASANLNYLNEDGQVPPNALQSLAKFARATDNKVIPISKFQGASLSEYAKTNALESQALGVNQQSTSGQESFFAQTQAWMRQQVRPNPNIQSQSSLSGKATLGSQATLGNYGSLGQKPQGIPASLGVNPQANLASSLQAQAQAAVLKQGSLTSSLPLAQGVLPNAKAALGPAPYTAAGLDLQHAQVTGMLQPLDDAEEMPSEVQAAQSNYVRVVIRYPRARDGSEIAGAPLKSDLALRMTEAENHAHRFVQRRAEFETGASYATISPVHVPRRQVASKVVDVEDKDNQLTDTNLLYNQVENELKLDRDPDEAVLPKQVELEPVTYTPPIPVDDCLVEPSLPLGEQLEALQRMYSELKGLVDLHFDNYAGCQEALKQAQTQKDRNSCKQEMDLQQKYLKNYEKKLGLCNVQLKWVKDCLNKEKQRQEEASLQKIVPQSQNGLLASQINGGMPSPDEMLIEASPTVNESATSFKGQKVNPLKTFANFVPSHETISLLHTVQLLASDPGNPMYNPLYIYGKSGLGKTHILNAIANDIMVKFPNVNLLFSRAEDFIKGYVEMVKSNTNRPQKFTAPKDRVDFNSQFRNCEVLIIDDVQNFSKARNSREAFFEVIADFMEKQNCQLILASDVSPKALENEGFHGRLTSRFGSGVCCEMSMPNIRARRTITVAKSIELGIKLSETLIDYIAFNINTNVREIEGAVKTLNTHIYNYGQISFEEAKQRLDPFIPVDGKKVQSISGISIEEIKGRVAFEFGVSVPDLESASKKKSITTARAIAMLVAKALIRNISVSDLGREFNKDHSSVSEAIKRMLTRLKNDPQLDKTYKDLVAELSQRVQDDGEQLPDYSASQNIQSLGNNLPENAYADVQLPDL